MTSLSERLNYDREVIRVWFCNKRQALKNTIKKLNGSTSSASSGDSPSPLINDVTTAAAVNAAQVASLALSVS